MYKTSSEDRLHKQVNLADLNAVASLRDPKGRRNHMFGLFLPSRTYYFEADSDHDAKEWIELIRKEARIDEEEEMLLNSPGGEQNSEEARGALLSSGDDREVPELERIGSSSPEPLSSAHHHVAARGARILGPTKPSTINLAYSGPEHASFSDLSDAGFSRSLQVTSQSNANLHTPSRTNSAPTTGAAVQPLEPGIIRNASHKSESHVEPDERVIWHGYLLCLKSKGGVRQWKKLWSVLRAKNLAFYKNEEVSGHDTFPAVLTCDQEYSATLLLPLSSIINAVEIDPVSRSKSHCMQIISEDKSYRFCAPSEDALAKWLGALKSQLAKKKELGQKK